MHSKCTFNASFMAVGNFINHTKYVRRIKAGLGELRTPQIHLRRSSSPAVPGLRRRRRPLDYEARAECEALTGGCGIRTGYAASKVASVQPVSRVFHTPILQTKPHFFGAHFIAMAATEELSDILSRRQEINDKLEEGLEIKPKYKFVNVYTEFHEFSRKEIKQYEQTFNK